MYKFKIKIYNKSNIINFFKKEPKKMYKMTKELYVVFHKKNLTSTFLLQNRLGRHTYTHFYMEGNARVEACLSHGVGAGFICFYECALQARHK